MGREIFFSHRISSVLLCIPYHLLSPRPPPQLAS